MADTKKSEVPATVEQAPGQVEGAADAGTSDRAKGYKENPDKPDPSTVAQVEELKDPEGS